MGDLSRASTGGGRAGRRRPPSHAPRARLYSRPRQVTVCEHGGGGAQRRQCALGAPCARAGTRGADRGVAGKERRGAGRSEQRAAAAKQAADDGAGVAGLRVCVAATSVYRRLDIRIGALIFVVEP